MLGDSKHKYELGAVLGNWDLIMNKIHEVSVLKNSQPCKKDRHIHKTMTRQQSESQNSGVGEGQREYTRGKASHFSA